jgi:putative FmdB family regulatory protein
MPIYEYICGICKKKVSIFMKLDSYNPNPPCPFCEKTELSRIFSSFAIRSSFNTDSTFGPSSDYYKDPRNIGKHIEKSFQNMSMEMPSEIKQSIEAARGGQLPESLKDFNNASPDSSYH